MENIADQDQLASEKPTDLDLHCLQKQGISGFSRTWVKDHGLLRLSAIILIILCGYAADQCIC